MTVYDHDLTMSLLLPELTVETVRTSVGLPAGTRLILHVYRARNGAASWYCTGEVLAEDVDWYRLLPDDRVELRP